MNTYQLVQGTLEVSQAIVIDGRARLEGRFAGTLRQMMREDELEVTDGTFSAGDLPNVDEVRR